MASGGISGVAVAVASAGAVVVYAGFTGRSPLAALRSVSGGSPAPVSTKGTTVSKSSYTTSTGGTAALSGGTHPEIAQAALNAGDEVYSQSHRWDTGFSDCSSFVGKRLKENGITPPGASVTMSYRTWSKAATISRAEVGAGDLLCGTGHIAIALNGQLAIGQQRSGVNVKVDTIANIMYGQVGWVPRRYTGGTSTSGTAAA